MEKTSSTGSLPSDVMFEILTRLPLLSLERLKSICNEWRRMMCETSFIKLHMARTKNLNGYFVQSMKRSRYNSEFVSLNEDLSIPSSLNFLQKHVKIESSSSTHGLLCCTIQDRLIRYIICKPATKEWKTIPNPKMRYFTEKTEIVVQSSTPLHFKIIRFSWPKRNKDHMISEIFESQNWKWRRSTEIRMGDFELLSLGCGVLINGSLHWLTTQNRIFAFDVEDENWRMISLPKEEFNINENFPIVFKKVVEYEGCLSVCYYTHTWTELWVMKDIVAEVWEKKKRITIEKHGSIFEDLYTPEVALMFDYLKVIWYNFRLRKSMETKLTRSGPREAYAFKSDLDPLGQRLWRSEELEY